jgi:RNase H-fold protein (predicted Holliday junction resolvase)
MNAPEGVLGVDPGSAKAGYAVVGPGGQILTLGVEPLDGLVGRLRDVLGSYPVEAIALGGGTRARDLAATLRALELPVHFVDEFETSRRARELYFREHPPRGWRRLIPTGMQLPPRPVDDYAAVLIARRYLAQGPAGPFRK